MLILITIAMMLPSKPTSLFDFEVNKNYEDWMIVDDAVMGGRSAGQFSVDEQGIGVFHGNVSLENNGGFSSLRYNPETVDVSDYSKLQLYIKGDGKRYQFRVKTDSYDRHAYIHYFETDGSWQKVTIDMSEMFPTYRGRKLDMPNYPGEALSELAFLISNKQAEEFRLEIRRISLIE